MLRKLAPVLALGLVLSCGDDPGGPSGDVSITVTAPPSGGASADASYTVQWQTQGTSSAATLNLYYDTDNIPSSGLVLIAGGLQASAGSYAWDTTLIPDGVYYVRAVLADGSAGASDYSDGTLTVTHGTPTIVVTAPPASGAEADSVYQVAWQTLGFGSPTIDLYYDEDTDPSTGLVEIATGLSNTGTYNWDLLPVPEGYYYVYAVADEDTRGDRETASDYSEGTLTVNHGGLDPEITITDPPAGGATADNFFAVQWISVAPPASTVDLYYDTDTNPSSGLVVIQEDFPDDGYYMWNCSSVPEGSYYVYGIIDTGISRTAFRATASDYSDGMLTIDHMNPYTIELSTPPAGGATADESYTVEWTSDAPATETVDIFYAPDTSGAELYTAALDVPNSGSYDWSLVSVEEGTWWVYAVVAEDRGQGSDWSPGALTVEHESAYTFTFTAPPPSGATADDSYTLAWDTDAPPSASVSLYYSTTTSPGGTLVLIAQGVANTGSFLWNCSSVPDGTYYILGVVWDASRGRPVPGKGSGQAWSEGTLTVDHDPYSMEVTAPPAGGATADSSYTIGWDAVGGPSSVVDLFYDDDLDPATMYPIASGLANSGSYDWNTATVADGAYYVYAVIYDPGRPGAGRAWAADYSDGLLVIDHTYFYVIVTAPPPWGAWAEDQYTIQWAAAGPSGSTVDLFYDTDTDPSSGLVPVASDLQFSLFQYLWNCSTTPEGEYYIYATMTDGASTVSDYSDGTLTISRDPLWLYITEPNPGGATADDWFTVEWMSEGPPSRTIDLFYDTDTNPAAGLVEIILGLATSGSTDSYDWNCSAVPEGSYYVYGVLKEPGVSSDSVTSYSEGMLTVQH